MIYFLDVIDFFLKYWFFFSRIDKNHFIASET